MLRFEGDRDFSQAPAAVWIKLSDARFLSECIPGVESVSRSEAETVECVLRPGFAFVRGTLALTLQVVDPVANSSLRLLLHSKGIGSTSDVEAYLVLTPQASGTRLHWVAEIKTLGGLLKAAAHGLQLLPDHHPKPLRNFNRHPKDGEKRRFLELQHRRDACAAELGIDPTLIASRATLSDLAHDWGKYEGELMNWQRHLLVES